MKNHLLIYFLLILFISGSLQAFSQNFYIGIGQTKTSTSFRTSDFNKGGNHLLFTPKRGFAADIGVEYLVKDKTSLYSSFSFYQSGAKLEDHRVEGNDPYFLFDLKGDKYTYNSLSLNTNYNMEVWKAGNVRLMAVAGLHIDRILYWSNAKADFKSFEPSKDPLDMLTRFGAIRKLNVGCNVGVRAVYAPNQWSYSLNYTFAPRLFKMGKFEKEIDGFNLSGINGIAVREKVISS